MHRLFVALRPPAPIRESLLAVAGGVVGARWQDDEQLHLTLRYIGEVERPLAEDIAASLQTVHAAPLTISTAGVGWFGSGQHGGGAIWAGVSPHDALAALHRKIDHALVRCGLPPERRAYLPHITLARLPRAAVTPSAFLERHAGLTSPPFSLRHFLLYESELSPNGARYEVIARYPLLL